MIWISLRREGDKLASAGSDSRRPAEGIFVRSVINQVQNLNVQTADKEEIKQIVAHTLIGSLPELVKHPSVAREIRNSAEKYLSELIDKERSVNESDLVKAASLLWARSEQEVAQALAAVMEQADGTVERVFKQKEIVYQRLKIWYIAPRERTIYEQNMNKI